MKIKPVWVLSVLAVILAGARWHTYNEPLERDVATYSVIAHEMLAGRSLYSDIWDNKPPAIHVTFAISQALAGETLASVFLVNVVGGILVLLGCYAAGFAMGGTRCGLIAAGLWTLISGDLYLQGNQPTAELFINACLVSFFALRLRPEGIRKTRVRRVVSGLLVGLATLYKYTAILPVAAIGVVDLFLAAREDREHFQQTILEWTAIAGVAAAVWTAVLLYFSATHRLYAFFDKVFLYNVQYAFGAGGDLQSLSSFQRLARALVIPLSSPVLVTLTLPLIVLSLFGAVVGLFSQQHRLWALGVAYGFGSWLTIALQGHFFAHHYQELLPVWIVAAAALWGLPGSTRIRQIASGLAVISLLCWVQREAAWYRLPAETWSELKYEDRFTGAPALSVELNHWLLPGESFYNWGNDPELYFYTQRRYPTGLFGQYPLVREPGLDAANARVIQDLEKAKPEIVVVSKYMLAPVRKEIPIVAWIQKNYKGFPGGADRGSFILLVRRGGALEARLKAKAA